MHVFLYQIDKFNRHYKIAVIVSTILPELLGLSKGNERYGYNGVTAKTRDIGKLQKES